MQDVWAGLFNDAISAMEYEIVIGLEVHSQLKTRSKMFCSCDAGYQDAPPNSVVCEVCLGMPGVLPVINSKAVELVIATGLALDCEISSYTKFDRKNYPYPDLMKGYQISQYDQPIAGRGSLVIDVNGDEKSIGITRVHLEEDVAKLLHRSSPDGDSYSLMDVNRAGVPLMEIVSDPDMRAPEEATTYLTTLRSILRYIGVSTANMEEGSFRCDANISVRPVGSMELGTKVEVKNMNSFRSVFSALEYETARQIGEAKEGQPIVQETRGWDEERGVTVSQRTKEHTSDYRFFPEPDLPPLVIDPAWVDEVRGRLPELPQARKARLVRQYGLSVYDAGLLTSSKPTVDFFEEVLRVRPLAEKDQRRLAKSVSNWMLGELSRLLNTTGGDVTDVKFRPQHLIELLDLIDDDTLSTGMARSVFEEMFKTGRAPRRIARETGMAQISDAAAVQPAVDEAIASNAAAVTDYLGGKETAIKFLVGQVMKITGGKANPKLVAKLVTEKLDSMR